MAKRNLKDKTETVNKSFKKELIAAGIEPATLAVHTDVKAML